MASKVFTAHYDGLCGECGDEIEPGDEVQYVDDELVHADCSTEISGGIEFAVREEPGIEYRG